MTGEYLIAGILDFYPQAQSLSNRYVYGHGSRLSTTDALNSPIWNQSYMLDNATAALTRRVHDWIDVSGVAPCLIFSLSGNILYHPREFFASTAALTGAYAGRAYQQIVLSSGLGDQGTIVNVPLDTGVVGQFRVVQGGGVQSGLILAIRVG